MSDPIFGISITRVDNEPRPASVSDMSVVGLVGTAPNANAQTFPLNTPVFLYSDEVAKLVALGTTGTLPDAIQGINDQLGEFQIAAKVVVIRIAEGVNDRATIANIVGSSLNKTGIWALREAGPAIGIIPRLIGVPGYTHQRETGLDAITMGVRGMGYVTAPNITFTGGGGSGAAAVATIANGITIALGNGGDGYTSVPTVNIDPPPAGGIQATAVAVLTGDEVTAITVTDPGLGYAEVPNVVLSGGGGTGATATATLSGRVSTIQITNGGIDYTSPPTVVFNGGTPTTPATATATIADLANAVCVGLPPVLEALLAHAVVDGPVTSQEAWTDWRETLQSMRLIATATAVKVGVNALTKPLSPRVIGIGVRRDHEFQGRPFHSWANQPVQGIVGPNRSINFSLTEGATEGQVLLSQNAGILVRGEMGVETAIASGGFVFIGTDNLSEDVLWQFYNVSRGRDFIHLMFLRTLRYFLGRRNIDYGTITDILDTMKFALRDIKADGDIIDYKVGFTRDQNSPEQLRLGKFTVDFAAEEPPVLRYLGIRSARYRPALDTLLDDLLAQIEVAT